MRLAWRAHGSTHCVLADVRQVFQHQYRVLDGLDRCQDFSGDPVEYAVNLVPQCVTEMAAIRSLPRF